MSCCVRTKIPKSPHSAREQVKLCHWGQGEGEGAEVGGVGVLANKGRKAKASVAGERAVPRGQMLRVL